MRTGPTRRATNDNPSRLRSEEHFADEVDDDFPDDDLDEPLELDEPLLEEEIRWLPIDRSYRL